MYLIELARTIQEDKERQIKEAGRRRRLEWLLAEPTVQQADHAHASAASDPTPRPSHQAAHTHPRPIRQP